MPLRQTSPVTAGNRASERTLLLAAALLAIAVVMAPGVAGGVRSALGVDVFREPFTSLSFADPEQAAVGFRTGDPITVTVDNETGGAALLTIRATDGSTYREEVAIQLSDGESRDLIFTVPTASRSVRVEIVGRDVVISAEVLP